LVFELIIIFPNDKIMNLVFSGFLFLTVLLQTNIFPSFFPSDIKPDLFLGLTLYIGLSHSSSRGLIWGLIGGALLDIFSEGIIGPNTLSLMSIGVFAGYIRNYLLAENALIQAVMVVASTFFQWSLASIYKGTFQATWSFWRESGYFLSLQIFFNLISSFFIFGMFNLLKRKKVMI